MVELQLQRVAASFRGVSRHVPETLELVLLPSDAIESPEQIVRVENRKAPGSFRQRRQDLLIGRSRWWECRHDRPRLVVRRIVVIGRRTAGTAAGAPTSPTLSSTASASSRPTFPPPPVRPPVPPLPPPPPPPPVRRQPPRL